MPLQADAVLHYAQLRAYLESAGAPLSPNDLLIAANALALDAALVSADVAFTRVPGLKLENWLVETT
jgi:tRNA(fMet)-specific endonuclease VapC